ncbi:MAG: Non-phosphorylating glyceraldehyde-3-phosphate dehydrogenase (NADP) (EC [uncultured Sulfurovum sp.]|uniref:Non-phosphorylating glyceraldehyde-3-phosphate dehydrogenase (NADP) (EC) n=1 Tax=uncultured Sulfurovum sp. TaxID=269237 RepID=A0A6S6T939_9BACT|nr:MAG: Non-phosphorylating glyceraldehyde-3-phosphate dehydrogenase (NADP) (EC [uncultured Sulfurovum sp.]
MKTINVEMPYNGEIIERVEVHGKEVIEKALENAYAYYLNQEKWLKKYEIISILEKTIKIMEERFESLVILATREGGKPYMDSKVEVERAISGIKVAIENMAQHKGEVIPMGHTKSSDGRLALTIQEPIGVVVAISAFNHPLNLTVHQVIPTLAVGAPVIIKPSTRTPLSAINLVKILHEAGLPKAMCQVFVCDREAGEWLVKSPKSAFLTFVGSAKVGWHLNRIASDGTRVALEHGGVAPVIIDKDANIDALIPLITKGGFYHAGQVCVSVQRVYVHEEIIKEVSKKFSVLASQLKVGDPLAKDTEVGPLISHAEVNRIEAWVNEAKENGAKVLCGGKRISESCYEPTLLLNPKKSDKVSTQEVFGPVVCLYAFSDIEEAYKDANALEVSFQAAVFTKNIDTALKSAKRLNATTVMVNDHTAFRVDWMPFGGAKQSGLGMGGIVHAMKEMSNEKMLVIKSEVL